jgi:hypothetical protein
MKTLIIRMREKTRERKREGGKHWVEKFQNKNPESIGYRNNVGRTTSFFITNFPTETTSTELWKIFSRYWKVGEVYIPAKLDKAGRKFGFVRFEDVENYQYLLSKIEETWIGTYKIRANLPKFKRGEGQKVAKKEGGGQVEVKRNTNLETIQDGNRKSFKDAVAGVNNNHKPRPADRGEVPRRRASKRRLTDEEYRKGIMEIAVDSNNLKKLEDSFVGSLWEAGEAENIQITLWMEGYQHIKATTMGLDLILLTTTDAGGIEKAYASNKEWWERWFSSVKPWRPDILPRRRRVWVRLFGVPLHIWGWEGFFKIVYCFGKLKSLDPETLNHSRYDVARVQLEVASWDMLDKVVEIKVDEEIFIVRMVEERVGGSDFRRCNMGVSNNGVARSEDDSVGNPRRDNSMLGVEDGWSENLSDDHVSIDGGRRVEVKDRQVPLDKKKNQSVNTCCPVEHEEREVQSEKVNGPEEDVQQTLEVAETDGGFGGGKEVDLVEKNSVVQEAGQYRVAVGEVDALVEDNVVQDEVTSRELVIVQCGPILETLENGPGQINFNGPCQQNSKGKEIVVYNDKQDIRFKGSCSKWASLGVGPVAASEEYQEVQVLKDKELALLDYNYSRRLKLDIHRNTTEGGCKNWPPLSGPNKWASLAKARKSQKGGKKSKRKKSKSKTSKRRLEDSQEDPIQDCDSSSLGENGVPEAQKMIPISNIQIVLNQGELCSMVEGTNRQV